MPNLDERFDWVEHLTSVDAIERHTGYDFLTRLAPDVEDAVEARVDRFEEPTRDQSPL